MICGRGSDVDGGVNSPARCRGSNFQFEPRQFRPQGETAESCGFCASCHPHQISLAPLCGTSEICKEAIFALGNGISRRKNQLRLRRARRFCRFSKSSKSVGLGRLESPMGFQPSRRSRFLCERAAALSRSPGALGRASLAFSRSLGGGARFASLLALTRGTGARFACLLALTRGWVALRLPS